MAGSENSCRIDYAGKLGIGEHRVKGEAEVANAVDCLSLIRCGLQPGDHIQWVAAPQAAVAAGMLDVQAGIAARCPVRAQIGIAFARAAHAMREGDQGHRLVPRGCGRQVKFGHYFALPVTVDPLKILNFIGGGLWHQIGLNQRRLVTCRPGLAKSVRAAVLRPGARGEQADARCNEEQSGRTVYCHRRTHFRIVLVRKLDLDRSLWPGYIKSTVGELRWPHDFGIVGEAITFSREHAEAQAQLAIRVGIVISHDGVAARRECLECKLYVLLFVPGW
jgi:hypothetical protein